MRKYFCRLCLVCLLATLSLAPERAHAWAVYWDWGFGVGQFIKAAPYFGAGAASKSSIGFGLNYTLMYNFMSVRRWFQVHGGLKANLVSAGADGQSYAMVGAYPLVRFEIWRFYLGLGATPFVYKSTQGFSGLSNTTRDQAVLAEVGVMWRVVPFFYLSLEGNAQIGRTSGGSFSPLPAYSGGLAMRFFIYSSHEAETTKYDFDGWRYPFGIDIW